MVSKSLRGIVFVQLLPAAVRSRFLPLGWFFVRHVDTLPERSFRTTQASFGTARLI